MSDATSQCLTKGCSRLKPESVELDQIHLSERCSFLLFPPNLDTFLSPVILPKQLSVVYGYNRLATTTLAHTLVVSAARTGAPAVYLDSGNNYSPQLARAMCIGVDDVDSVISRVSVAKVLNLVDFKDVVDHLNGVEGLQSVVIDSLTSVLNLSSAPGSRGRARSLFGALERLRRLVNEHDCHIMMTDCSTRSWSSGVPAPIGGNVLSHSVDTVVRIDALDSPQVCVRLEVERSTMPLKDTSIVMRVTRNGFESL